MQEDLAGIQQFDLLYPRQGAKGTSPIATVLSKRTLVQKSLVDALGLDELLRGGAGNTPRIPLASML